MNEVRQAQHTPAPWYWQEFGVCGGDGPSAFRIEAGTGTVADTYAYSALDEANARLIAAAPELLEALELAADFARYGCTCTFCTDRLARFDAAIAKATGGAL